MKMVKKYTMKRDKLNKSITTKKNIRSIKNSVNPTNIWTGYGFDILFGLHIVIV